MITPSSKLSNIYTHLVILEVVKRLIDHIIDLTKNRLDNNEEMEGRRGSAGGWAYLEKSK